MPNLVFTALCEVGSHSPSLLISYWYPRGLLNFHRGSVPGPVDLQISKSHVILWRPEPIFGQEKFIPESLKFQCYPNFNLVTPAMKDKTRITSTRSFLLELHSHSNLRIIVPVLNIFNIHNGCIKTMILKIKINTPNICLT